MRPRCPLVWVLLVAAMLGMATLHAETWYVRADGGTRFSATAKTGQCDGKADAPYPGKGVNRHCAFGDYRFLWDDQHNYGKFEWAIAGGDTVILDNTRAWRVGFDQGKTANDPWCFGGNGTFSCSNTPIPPGTPAQHTRILGRNHGACTRAGNEPDPARMTQIFGGFGVWTALNLTGTHDVDIECIEITSHAQCIVHGTPQNPRGCNRDGPIDDFDQEGIQTDIRTREIFLQDLWVHGHTDRGIKGPIGGLVVANRVRISVNGMAGWDFDDGNGTPSTNAKLVFTNSTIEFSGCNAIWPSPVAVSCYGQSSGGYGDGIGTPAGMGMDVEIDHSVFRYNTQDGEDFGHIDTGAHTIRITNSLSYGNGGGQFKWGPNFTSAFFANNLVVGNCMRMSAPLPGLPANYNEHLGDFCRALDGVSFNLRQGSTAVLVHNTFAGYSPTTFDIGCGDASCSSATLVFENNIVLGYENPGTFNLGGKSGGPGGFFFEKPVGKVVRSNNVFSGLRNVRCLAHELCTDPKFAGEPHFTREQDLDSFNFHLAEGSPARAAAMPVDGVPVDYEGKPRAGKPTIGALEP